MKKEQQPAEQPLNLRERLVAEGDMTSVFEVMTTPVKCATVGTSLPTVAAFFLHDRISAVPVVDVEGIPIGVLSKTDLLQRYLDESETTEQRSFSRNDELDLPFDREQGFHLEHLVSLTVEEVMTPSMLTVNADEPVSRAAALMASEHIHHLAVVDKNGRAVGILSAWDIMRWLAQESGYTW